MSTLPFMLRNIKDDIVVHGSPQIISLKFPFSFKGSFEYSFSIQNIMHKYKLISKMLIFSCVPN